MPGLSLHIPHYSVAHVLLITHYCVHTSLLFITGFSHDTIHDTINETGVTTYATYQNYVLVVPW